MHPFFILKSMKNTPNILTVLEVLKLSTAYLEEKGIESARLNAELLLANILNCKRIDLYLLFDRPLDENEIVAYREFISRCGKHEPLQYILGEVEFYGLKFKVNKNVLIPRPETEFLIEQAISLVKGNNLKSILDIGTGAGNIPITLAKNLNGVAITSIDISEEACKVAEENTIYNEVKNKINLLNTDINDYICDSKFDMIISNPPYVSSSDYRNLSKDILNYEPAISITDFSDGYEFYRIITKKSDTILNKGGFLLCEMAQGQSEFIQKLFSDADFSEIKIIKDFQNIDRVIIGRKL